MESSAVSAKAFSESWGGQALCKHILHWFIFLDAGCYQHSPRCLDWQQVLKQLYFIVVNSSFSRVLIAQITVGSRRRCIRFPSYSHLSRLDISLTDRIVQSMLRLHPETCSMFAFWKNQWHNCFMLGLS